MHPCRVGLLYEVSGSICLTRPQSDHVADTLVTGMFLRYGTPRIIHSDQAAEFQSELMKELTFGRHAPPPIGHSPVV